MLANFKRSRNLKNYSPFKILGVMVKFMKQISVNTSGKTRETDLSKLTFTLVSKKTIKRPICHTEM